MSRATLIITGEAAWHTAVRDQFANAYDIQQVTVWESYIETVIASRAALILVDDGADWHLWTSTPKSSPATRRIPVVLVSDDLATCQKALTQGADFAYIPAELLSQLPHLLTHHARIPDPQVIAQIACACDEPLPDLAKQGIAQFNAGEYYAQHDLFEALWMQTEQPIRDLYRAILQVGIAYYQIERGNYRGALKMLQRSVQWLLILPDHCQGIDVRQLRADSFALRAELLRLGEARFAELDHTLIKPLIYQDSQSQ